MTVRTRFAPSPTGYLHIGGVRTALYNWLFTRRHGGRFVLRIDDTDAGRNVDEALEPILEGFRWLGLDWDEGPGVGGDHGPYYQSQRADRHREVAGLLVERGAAYWDYATPEEIAVERTAAQERGERFVTSRRFRAETDEERRRFEAEGRSGAVRLAMPREGQCRFTDLVRGDVAFDWAGEQDHVIQRADGTCLYHLASAVDDHDMEITHVIRAEEHLSNTARHVFIATSLGWEPPAYAHLPYVAEPGSRHKLSKRKLAKYLLDPDFARLAEHGRTIAERAHLPHEAETFNPVLVDFYREVGYLPDALLNYLLLLGWSLDDRTEHFDRESMIEHFDLGRVNRSPASFDPAKLEAFQARWMAALPVDERLARCLPYLERAGWVASPPSAAERAKARAVVEAAADRIAVAGDVLDYRELFAGDHDYPFDPRAWEKRLVKPPETAELLAAFRNRLAAADPFDATTTEAAMRAFCDERGIGLGAIIHAVRVAVTGKAAGFGMFEILEILGRESTLARLDRTLERLDTAAGV